VDCLSADVDRREPRGRQDNRFVAEEVAQSPQQRGFACSGSSCDEKVPCFFAQISQCRLVLGGGLNSRRPVRGRDDASRLLL
jgi:hypothetical protein